MLLTSIPALEVVQFGAVVAMLPPLLEKSSRQFEYS